MRFVAVVFGAFDEGVEDSASAAGVPPPTNSQFFLPTAVGRMAFSIRLLSKTPLRRGGGMTCGSGPFTERLLRNGLHRMFRRCGLDHAYGGTTADRRLQASLGGGKYHERKVGQEGLFSHSLTLPGTAFRLSIFHEIRLNPAPFGSVPTSLNFA